MDSLLKLPQLRSSTDTKGLRRLYDQIEAHVRGLKSLDVPDTEYGALLLPILIGKIPDEIRILLGRKMTGESWNLNTLLENFREELENRERCEGIQALSFRDGRNFNEQRGGRKYSNTPFTAAALMTSKTTINCSFCQKEHTSASCFVVTDIEARKQILRKQGRCFLCLKRNHIARDCESRYMCKYCSGKHHVSLCNNNSRQSLATNSRQSLATRQESNSRQQLGNVQDSLAKEQTTQLRDTKDTGNTKETRNYHACLQDSVSLQTAKAKVGVGNKKLTTGTEVRVIFYSGSQRSYLTQRVRNKLQLPTGSTESLRIKTFGECETELTGSCETVNLAVGDITGRTRTQVEAFVVPVICAPLGNQEIDRAQVEYKHLSDLNLADNNEGDGVAEIDLLIGADQIGKFFTGKIRRGENANSPIASETILGWVLSGPMPSRKKTTLSSVNFVSTHVLRVAAELPSVENEKQPEELLHRLWDLESIGGGESTDDAYIMYRQMKSCFAAGNFNLRKWATNSPVLMAQIQNDEEVLKSLTTEHLNNTGESSYAKESIGGLEEIETPKEHKVLGMNWDTDSDTFVLKLTKVVQFARNLEPSKRNVLKIAAKLFDPLGLRSSVTVLLRMLLQELCAAKYEWDAVISQSNQKVLEKWIDDLETVSSIVVPRYYFLAEERHPESVTLHGFGDASQKACCAVIYICMETDSGRTTNLVASKSRVTPLAPMSIPRLQLIAALILARLMSVVKETLSKIFNITETTCWTDSSTVLHWIKGKKDYKQFVQNRIDEILRLTDSETWRFCPGLENPANIGSRGQKASELAQNDLWWKGPQWLTLDPSAYPNREFSQSDVELSEECMKECRVKLPTKGNTTVVNVTNVSETHPPETVGSTKISEIIDHKSYSSVTKLFRVTAWVKRFIRNLKTKKACEVGEVVLVQGEGLPRSQWKIGRVEALLKSKDGEVRGVKLRALNKKGKPIVLRRPIQKLVPLEIKEERKNEDSKESKQDADIQKEEKPTKQRRIAAINADLKRQSMIDQL
ncbi:Hypothetical predicted protein [Paramuricea clavata]|uniref:Uncharacterized protein n=1 Tax=Paramuricea clavata TaxID=317549 RepID=A0A7D9I2J1_PARCT|nr:Hypothetical predicted protein [Paramuricea clavata]